MISVVCAPQPAAAALAVKVDPPSLVDDPVEGTIAGEGLSIRSELT